MTAEELATYPVGVAGDGARCFLCARGFKPNELAVLVPSDCEQTVKMHAGEAYAYQPAHRACMERVP